ncbi:MAG: hypothetical protein KDD11_04330, partial [Acidobacteria bacterium]|nr:hypothetical protein [Acidobacteriota bacterium]
DGFRLSALLATPDGRSVARGEATGGEPSEVARRCIEALRDDGADEVLVALAGRSGSVKPAS